MEAVISKVDSGSIAEECGIEPGDIIKTINGKTFCDILEYRFLCADEYIELEVLKNDGNTYIFEIENDNFEELGITFEKQLLDDMKSCRNKCIFCFIDQLPKNMRKPLYFKDDDARMSFLMGNYVTLTNMSDNDIDKIIEMRLSPINISVHTTNPDLRSKMLNNRFAGNINERLKKFYDAKVTVNCQIVSCPGINDGPELNRTLCDLGNLFPYINSVSIVPVGITKFREGLYPLEPYNKNTAEQIINQVEKFQKQFLNEFGTRLVYLADEFYILAEKPIPNASEYENFPQIENGVGLISSMREEFNISLNDIKISKNPVKKSIVTGVISESFINSLVNRLKEIIPNLDVEVYAIKNEFFGEKITVSGLICGCDIIKQLKGKDLGEELLLPSCMFKAGQDVFLDDITLEDIEKELNIKVIKVSNNGFDFTEKIIK